LIQDGIDEGKIWREHVICKEQEEELAQLRTDRIEVENENYYLKKDLMKELRKNQLVHDPLMF